MKQLRIILTCSLSQLIYAAVKHGLHQCRSGAKTGVVHQVNCGSVCGTVPIMSMRYTCVHPCHYNSVIKAYLSVYLAIWQYIYIYRATFLWKN